jgi:hypothetical protein
MAIRQDVYAVPRADLGTAIREYDIAAQAFIARDALPILAMQRQAATLTVHKRESILQVVDAAHKDGSAYNRAGIETEDLAYACKEYGEEEPLTDVQRKLRASDFDAELEITEVAMHRMLMVQELRTSALLFNTTTWNGVTLYTDNKAAPWSTAASSAIGQVLAAKAIIRANIGAEPNALIIGAAAMDNLLKNTEILARFVGAGVITEAILRANMAALFGLQYLLVGKKSYNTAKEGQAFISGQIWDYKYAMLAKIAEGNTVANSGLGRTILWAEDSPENEMVEQYRDEFVRADIFRVRQFVQEKVFDAYFAHLMRIET